MSPYLGMGNVPVMGVDPDGNVAWFVPLIIGAALNVGSQALAGNINNFWDGLGYAAIGAASGALGAGIANGVSAALGGASSFGAGFASAFSANGTLAAAGLTGVGSSFFNGAAIGASAGFSAGFTSGFGNAVVGGKTNALGKGINTGFIGGLLGGLIGGISQGIDAVKDGRRFFDGATVQNNVIADRNLPFVKQMGDYNCGPANCGALSKVRGGSVTQNSIRNSLGGNSNTTPLKDLILLKEFKKQSGTRFTPIPGSKINIADVHYKLKFGFDVTFNLKSQSGVGHAVSLNRVTERTITKLSGKVINRTFYHVMNPARGQYIPISLSKLKRAYNLFYIFP